MRILDILNAPWAISTRRLMDIQSVYRAHFHGEKIDWKALEAKAGILKPAKENGEKPYEIINGVAVINISGVLTKTFSFFSWLFGGSSMQQIGDIFRAAISDPQVQSVLLVIDSPGGTVDGTQELADLIYSGKAQKQVVAYSDGMIASAAYWIGSAADAIYISGDTVEVGSIGVVATHIDSSKFDEMIGDKYTEITAGKYKRIASAHSPLTDEGRRYIQDQVDHIYTAFVGDVARNRNISIEQALSMADGKIFIGKQAVEVGLVDGVATFDQLINMMAAGAPDIKRTKITKKEEETVVMDINELKEKHADVYQAAVTIGKKEAETAMQTKIDTARSEGIAAGADAERKRIIDIQAQAVPGQEQIITDAIADGKSTAGEVAVKILAAEKNLRAQKGKDAADDAAALKDVKQPPVSGTDNNGVDQNLPLERRAQAEWDKDPKLREEFKLGGFAAYLAYKKNEGNIRIKK